MWLFVGTVKTLDRVIGGKRVERWCETCDASTIFYEKKHTKVLEVYFVKMFAYRPTHVMACGVCDATYLTENLSSPTFRDAQRGTVLGGVAALVERVQSSINDACVRRAEAALRQARGSLREWLRR